MKILVTLAMILGLTALGGCGQATQNETGAFALGGAILGGAIGASHGHLARGAALGALAGAGTAQLIQRQPASGSGQSRTDAQCRHVEPGGATYLARC